MKKKPNDEPEIQDEAAAQARRDATLKMLNESYAAQLDESMGKLHNQFVAFISAAGLPLPQTLLVLEMLVKETIDQAHHKYIGE